ncbi:PTS sugar transporter subunit IIA [Micropruina sp.]|uniref:PTS sugar transporter subunit IIA n=1 Tax=Micropruina sp. TaxID=2737536 RepID=UPI0039E2728E
MEQTLVIVLIVAAVAVAAVYLLRKRQSVTPQAPVDAVQAQPARAAATDALAERVVVTSIVPDAPDDLAEIDDTNAVVKLRAIELNGTAAGKEDAIREAGGLLVAVGAVEESYIESMFERERSVSTYMGNLLAIPHGTNEALRTIQASTISVVRYPDGIEWNGNPVKFVIGIAANRGQHLELLGRIAEVFLDVSKVELLEQAATPEQVWRTLAKVNG